MKLQGTISFKKNLLICIALVFFGQAALAQPWPHPPQPTYPGAHYPPMPRPGVFPPGVPRPPMPPQSYPNRSPYAPTHQAPSPYPPAPNPYRSQQRPQNRADWYPQPPHTAPQQQRVQGVTDGARREYPTVDPGSQQNAPRKRYKSRGNPAPELSSPENAPRKRYKNRDNPAPSRALPADTATEWTPPEEAKEATPQQPVHDFRDFLKPAPRNRTTGGLQRKTVDLSQGAPGTPPSTMPPGDDLPPGETMEQAFPLNGP